MKVLSRRKWRSSIPCRSCAHHFSNAFWRNQIVTGCWPVLKYALLRRDCEAVKFLIDKGVMPREENLAELARAAPHIYDSMLVSLQKAGFRPSVHYKSRVELLIQSGKIEIGIDSVPTEWLKVLVGFQKNGAPEAVIAGGTLRDLFHSRSVKEIDIYLLDRKSADKNSALIRRAFSDAGLPIRDFETDDDGNRRKTGKLRQAKTRYLCIPAGPGEFSRTDAPAWTVNPHDTAAGYRIIFATEDFRAYDDNSLFNHKMLLSALPETFSRICCDGRNIIKTLEYETDTKKHLIRLAHSLDSAHLVSLINKYPEWDLCPLAAKLASSPHKPAQSHHKAFQS